MGIFNEFLLKENLKENIPRIEQRIRTSMQRYEVCPHCQQEIQEKSLSNVSSTPLVWKHLDCGGLVGSSTEAEQDSRAFWSAFEENEQLQEGIFGAGKSNIQIAVSTASRIITDIAKKYDVEPHVIVTALLGKLK